MLIIITTKSYKTSVRKVEGPGLTREEYRQCVLVLGSLDVRGRGGGLGGGGRHHLIVNHAVVLREVIYSPAIAVLPSCEEFRYAEIKFIDTVCCGHYWDAVIQSLPCTVYNNSTGQDILCCCGTRKSSIAFTKVNRWTISLAS